MRRHRYQKGVATAETYDSDSDEGAVIGTAEWTKNKKTVSCPWVKTTKDNYDFDITKADQIFDL